MCAFLVCLRAFLHVDVYIIVRRLEQAASSVLVFVFYTGAVTNGMESGF